MMLVRYKKHHWFVDGMNGMKQMTLSAGGFEQYGKTTRRAVFLAEMNRVVPWSALCAVVEPHYPKAGNGRPPIGLERMLRIYFLQQWFNLSDPAVEEALYLLDRDWHAVQEEEQVKITKPKIGIMVEVPSVLLQIEEFSELVDFFSVGSNDLTQYLLAVDRNNPRVANVYSHLHPAVLRALTRLVQECHKYDKPVSICGEMAGDPLSAVLLMAMGFNTLSMSSSNILRVRKAICHVPMTEAQEQLEHVLNMSNPLMVKSWMEYYFKTHGLADMVKASTRIVSA